jgi:hypothetical protein
MYVLPADLVSSRGRGRVTDYGGRKPQCIEVQCTRDSTGYPVNINLLRGASPVIDEQLEKQDSQAARDRFVELSIYSETLEMLLNWLVYGELKFPRQGSDLEKIEDLSRAYEASVDLKCHADFEDSVMDALYSRLTRKPPIDWSVKDLPGMVESMKYKIPEGTKAWQFLVEWLAAFDFDFGDDGVNSKQIGKQMKDTLSDFFELREAVSSLAWANRINKAGHYTPQVVPSEGCRYHVHVERGSPCYRDEGSD